jgi:hypothetical protein
MCMACEMEAMWFAAMEARARAVAEVGPQAALPPLRESGEPAAPLPRDHSRRELGGSLAEGGGASTALPRFVCEETQTEEETQAE